MPEEAVLLLVLYFSVRNRGLAYRTPIDNAGSLVNISLLVELCKYLKHCVGAALVHGEALSVPVGRGSQLVQLIYDSASVLFLPLPGLL